MGSAPPEPEARGRIADGGSPNFRLEAHQLFQHVASDPATPPDLLELIQARGRAVTEAMRQLVTEVQADGEAARDDGLIDRVNEYAAMPPLPALG